MYFFGENNIERNIFFEILNKILDLGGDTYF